MWLSRYNRAVRRALLVLAVGAVCVLSFLSARNSFMRFSRNTRATVDHPRLLANGYDTATITVEDRAGAKLDIALDGDRATAFVSDRSWQNGKWTATVHAGIVPGQVRFLVTLPGANPAGIDIETVLDPRDSLEDGTPDFLRLTDEHDRLAFRRWFTFLAEAQYFQAPEQRPSEIKDCAALIRYAYRETLHAHDSAWTATAQLPLVPAFESVARYKYPHTPLGAALFRVRRGPFRASDLADGAFAQFADAQTLWRLNCHFVSREVSAAKPGDLFFFRQEAGRREFHSMIYLGESQIRSNGNRYVVYHTGDSEMKRLSMKELAEFPQSEWRPLASNPAFLGVYRWNILCAAGTE